MRVNDDILKIDGINNLILKQKASGWTSIP